MFLVFPLSDKPSWRRPPVWTLLLILINCIVFFGPQQADSKRDDAATAYYVGSSLPMLELPHYLTALEQKTDAESMKRRRYAQDMYDSQYYRYLLDWMENDADFMQRLHGGEVIKRTHPLHEKWNKQRTKYEELRGERFTEHWYFVPAQFKERPETILSSMFMHGSTSHLVGNMVFLFAFGYTVELALGGFCFILFYLIAGACGDLLSLAVHWGSTQGSLGASGAISGLMAMYAALYGRTRIKFFYWLFFYFDKIKAPALLLLPAWLMNEVLQFVFNKHSNVGYMAHAGGLIGGAILVFAYKALRPSVTAPVAAEAPVDTFPADLARAQQLLKQLKLDEAMAAFAGLCKRRPDDLSLLKQYAGLARLNPASDHYHRSAGFILALRGKDEESVSLMLETWREYAQKAQPCPRVPPEKLLPLAMAFLRHGHLNEAVGIERMLRRLAPQLEGLASLHLGLVDQLLQQRQQEVARQYVELLTQTRPQSSEARLAQDRLARA